MRVLRSITATHRYHESDDLATAFEPRPDYRRRHQVRHQRIRGHHDVCAGNEDRVQRLGPREKERIESREVILCQRGESWEGSASVAIERRRNSPHAAAPSTKLLLLFRAVFDEPVRGIGDDGLYASLRLRREPAETVTLKQPRAAVGEDRLAETRRRDAVDQPQSERRPPPIDRKKSPREGNRMNGLRRFSSPIVEELPP